MSDAVIVAVIAATPGTLAAVVSYLTLRHARIAAKKAATAAARAAAIHALVKKQNP